VKGRHLRKRSSGRSASRKIRQRVKLGDPSRASDLRAYLRRHDALAIDNGNGTLDVHLLKPFSSAEDERGVVGSYLRVWERMSGVPVDVLD